MYLIRKHHFSIFKFLLLLFSLCLVKTNENVYNEYQKAGVHDVAC